MLRRWLITLLVVIVLAATGSAALGQGGRLQVVASFSILADVARSVAGNAADVTSLMPLAADPHSFTAAPQDLVALADSDVVLVVGAGFEASLMESITNAGVDTNVVVVSNCVEILPFGEAAHEDEAHEQTGDAAVMCANHHAELEDKFGTVEPGAITPLGDLYTLDCGGHEERAGDEHGEEDHEHEHGNCDPHVWTAPYNAMLWTLNIRDLLSEFDPANAEVYAANAAAYLDQLQALDGEIAAQIDTIPQANRRLVTNHETLGYYANRYGLEMVGTVIPSASTLAEPSAVEIARLIDAIKAQGVPAVFAESTTNPDLARQIASESGVAFYTVYTDSLSESGGPAATYLDYMRYNTRTIVEALGGAIDG